MNKPMTSKEMKDWVDETWEACSRQEAAMSTELRRAAAEALRYMKEVGQMDMHPHEWSIVGRLETALSTQSTHSADCYKWHHECAIARIEELKLLCEEMLSELYVYRASKHLKDAAAAIRARGEK